MELTLHECDKFTALYLELCTIEHTKKRAFNIIYQTNNFSSASGLLGNIISIKVNIPLSKFFIRKVMK